MDDVLRKILYPLVLPCLVTAVWGYAWTRKYDDQMNAGGPIIVKLPGGGVQQIPVLKPLPARAELHFVGRVALPGEGQSFEAFATTEQFETEEE